MKKLEEEELARLNETTKGLREARTTIADIEISLNRLRTQKQSVLFNAEKFAEQLNTIQEEMHQKYGNVLIDTVTGEIKEQNADS
jgi:archaellum component FlaC